MPRDLRSRLARWSVPDLTTGCWRWIGVLDKGGYGRIKVRGRFRLAHRAAYELFVGPIPPSLQIDHLCRTRCCVNPGHMEPVAAKENTMRGESFAARYAKRDACEHGHAYDAVNAAPRREGGRRCRACDRVYRLKRYHAEQEQRHVA